MDATNIILRLIWHMKSINIYQEYQYIRRKADKKRRIMVSFLRYGSENPTRLNGNNRRNCPQQVGIVLACSSHSTASKAP